MGRREMVGGTTLHLRVEEELVTLMDSATKKLPRILRTDVQRAALRIGLKALIHNPEILVR